MPGARSKGCRTCKQRRIKCDERTPICFQCEKSKRHCTGPDSPFRYQYGSVEQRAQLLQALDAITVDDNGGSTSASSLKWNRIAQLEETIDPVATVVPLTQSERLATTLISALEIPSAFGARLQQMGFHFGKLPPRLGRSRALDAAVNCFLYSFTAVSMGRPRNQSLELARYCTAISCLRQELAQYDGDGLLSTPSETLCASLLLAQYEILKPGPAYSFVTLSGGVSAILRGCGPSRAQSSEFEAAIFMSQYPTIITQCMLRGEDCFLSGREWANAMRRTGGADSESPVTAELWTILANLPGVLVRARELSPPSPSAASSPLYAELLSQIYKIRASIVVQSETVTRNLSTPGVHATYPRAYRGPIPAPGFHPESKLESLQPSRYIKQATFYHAASS
ncbi:Fungal Zn2-Cys6 binuclear cluster domain-containing protein [Cladophialophora immunda]|nr:Fungal Zn2-Cys6 binuclear cluster domain-containing protein [Cladophialophora immunda]